MNIDGQNMVTHFAISNAASQAVITSGNISALTEGQMAICNEGGEVLDADRKDGGAGSAFNNYRIAYVENGKLYQTPVIEHSNITSATEQVYVAKTEQVTYIGYNGTSGSITTANSNGFYAEVNIKTLPATATYGKHNEIKYFAYKSDSTATGDEIATGLIKNAIKNFSAPRETEQLIKFELLCSEAGVALGRSVDNITVTNGSKYFTATDIDDATANAALAVGDYLRIGTATTSPVYKITAIDTVNNIGTFDVPYQGTTATAADTSYERIAAADADDTDTYWGIKMTGVARDSSKFRVGEVEMHTVYFTVRLENFGTTEPEYSVAANPGTGSVYEVANTEWFAQGNLGNRERVGSPSPRSIALTDLTLTGYDILTVNWYSSVDGFGYGVKHPKSLIIATNEANTSAIHDNFATLFGL